MAKILFLGPVENYHRLEPAFEKDVFFGMDDARKFLMNGKTSTKKSIDWIVSFGYKYKLPIEEINKLPKNHAINIHISMLPWNRGMHPNLWSFLEGTPKGISIHVMDEHLDTGPILVQKAANLKGTMFSDTWKELMDLASRTFIEYWKDIRSGKIQPVPQTTTGGTLHIAKDLENLPKSILPDGWNTKIEEAIKNYKEWKNRMES